MDKKVMLAHCERALIDYKKSFWLPWLKIYFHTDYGFCKFFSIFSHNYVLLDYLKTIALEHEEFSSYAFWFKAGHVKPRIWVLKRAIKQLKNDISKEDTTALQS